MIKKILSYLCIVSLLSGTFSTVAQAAKPFERFELVKYGYTFKNHRAGAIKITAPSGDKVAIVADNHKVKYYNDGQEDTSLSINQQTVNTTIISVDGKMVFTLVSAHVKGKAKYTNFFQLVDFDGELKMAYVTRAGKQSHAINVGDFKKNIEKRYNRLVKKYSKRLGISIEQVKELVNAAQDLDDAENNYDESEAINKLAHKMISDNWNGSFNERKQSVQDYINDNNITASYVNGLSEDQRRSLLSEAGINFTDEEWEMLDANQFSYASGDTSTSEGSSTTSNVASYPASVGGGTDSGSTGTSTSVGLSSSGTETESTPAGGSADSSETTEGTSETTEGTSETTDTSETTEGTSETTDTSETTEGTSETTEGTSETESTSDSSGTSLSESLADMTGSTASTMPLAPAFDVTASAYYKTGAALEVSYRTIDENVDNLVTYASSWLNYNPDSISRSYAGDSLPDLRSNLQDNDQHYTVSELNDIVDNLIEDIQELPSSLHGGSKYTVITGQTLAVADNVLQIAQANAAAAEIEDNLIEQATNEAAEFDRDSDDYSALTEEQKDRLQEVADASENKTTADGL